jgi:ABC-2 type transport system ATP-binding protein
MFTEFPNGSGKSTTLNSFKCSQQNLWEYNWFNGTIETHEALKK